jgi:hypothetical protein
VEVAARSSTVGRLVVFDRISDVDAHRRILAGRKLSLSIDAPNVTLTTFAEEIAAAGGLPALLVCLIELEFMLAFVSGPGETPHL